MQVNKVKIVVLAGFFVVLASGSAWAGDGSIRWGQKFFPLHKAAASQSSAKVHSEQDKTAAPVRSGSFFSLASVRMNNNPNPIKLQYKAKVEKQIPKPVAAMKKVEPKKQEEKIVEVAKEELPEVKEAAIEEVKEEVNEESSEEVKDEIKIASIPEPESEEIVLKADSETDGLEEELPAEVAAKPAYQKAIRSILPKLAHAWPFNKGAAERITSIFGWRNHPVTHRHAFHQGVDIAAPVGTAVLASADGVVADAGRRGNLGNYVKIQHGDGSYSIYGHLKNWAVKVGALVKQGDKIAEVGVTGRTTGPHLHYSIVVDGKAVNPMKFLKKNLPDAQVALVM